MGHLPRWGDSSVDSQAMLSAYLHWTAHADPAQVDEVLPHLFIVDHRCSLLTEKLNPRVHGRAIPSRPCTEDRCRRCTNGFGGYKFRWIDSRWTKQYEAMRRPDSWTSLTLTRG